MAVNTKPKSKPKRPRLSAEAERNYQAFLRLRKKLAETHHGQWIGLVDGQVVATAPTLEALDEALDQIEPDPDRCLVFLAGEPYPLAQGKKLPILPLRW